MRYLSENKREDMRMKKRTAARSMAALMGAAMVLTACGGGNTTAPTTGASSGGETQTASESAESGKITKTDIVVGQASDIVTLDPAGQQDTTSGVLMKHAYSTLLDVDNEGKVVPDLAESYEMKSDTEYVFKLREDACFWDGTPVTAQDVKFSLDRAKGMPKTKSNTSKIEEVTVNGDHEVTIKLTEPYAAFKTIVTQHNLSILSEKAVTEAGDSYGDVDNLLGSGPFKVTVSFVRLDCRRSCILYTKPATKITKITASDLTLEPGKTGKLNVTSITCRVIPEGSARTIALEAGEIDVVWSVDPTDCANVESNPDVKLLSQPSTGIDYVGMNTQKEKFSDKRVRQAINYAINRENLVQVCYDGEAEVNSNICSKDRFGYSDDQFQYTYDPEKAKELLAEAGIETPYDLGEMLVAEKYSNIATVLQSDLAAVGLNVTIAVKEFNSYIGDLTSGNYGITALEMTLDGDTQMLEMAFTSDYIGTANNARYSDATMDELFEKTRTETDTDARKELFDEILTKAQDEAIYAVIDNPLTLFAYNTDLNCPEFPYEGIYSIYDFTWAE